MVRLAHGLPSRTEEGRASIEQQHAKLGASVPGGRDATGPRQRKSPASAEQVPCDLFGLTGYADAFELQAQRSAPEPPLDWIASDGARTTTMLPGNQRI
jgi:hypothetical protein